MEHDIRKWMKLVEATEPQADSEIVLRSGTRIRSLAFANERWLRGTRRASRIRNRLSQIASPVGGKPGSLSPDDVEELAQMLEKYHTILDQRWAEQQAQERTKGDLFAKSPEGIEARKRGEEQLAELQRKQQTEHEANISKAHAILACPIARYWRADRRAVVEKFANAGMVVATIDEAVMAVLETIPRIAKRFGFVRRHSSKSSGKADSRYLVYEFADGHKAEVRLSNHEIPVYGERFERYARDGGPRWAEIIVDYEKLSWPLERWKRELLDAVGAGEG